MIDIAIMIEGQNGLNWARWKRMAKAVEDLGFYGLYRSDHFTNAKPPDLDSLELWVSLTWLASHTQRIRFGPLVTPFSFRNPIITARMAKDVDDLSGSRLVLGLGAGWQEREHALFGFDLLDSEQRFDRMQEGVEVVTRLLQSDDPVQFLGDYYRVQGGILLPRPQRAGGPPILIGGNGPNRTLPLAAQYANEWNAIYLSPAAFSERNQRLNDLLAEKGREPAQVARSMMTRVIMAEDQASLDRVLQPTGRTKQEWNELGAIVGATSEVQDQMGALQEAGVQRLMLQWLDLDDLIGLEALAKGLLA